MVIFLYYGVLFLKLDNQGELSNSSQIFPSDWMAGLASQRAEWNLDILLKN